MAGLFRRVWLRIKGGAKRVFDDPTRQQLIEAGLQFLARGVDADITETEIDRLEKEAHEAITALRNLKEAK